MTSTRLATLLATMAAAMFLPLGTITLAQADDVPHPSPESAKIYAHGTGTNEFVGFMNAKENDGNDNAMGSGNLVNAAMTWTLTLAPALAGTLVLDAAKNIDLKAYLGSSQGVGRVTATTKITQGGTVLAEGAGVTVTITPADANSPTYYQLASWSVKPKFDRIEPGQDLVWTVAVSGTASNVFLGVGSARGRSHFVLPIVAVEFPAADEPIVKEFSGPVLEDNVTFENETTAESTYRWITNSTDVSGSLTVSGTSGTVGLTALDGSGTEVLTAAVDATESADNDSGSQTVELNAIGAAAGNWTILLNVTGFAGTIGLVLGPADLLAEPEEPDAAPVNETTEKSAPEGANEPAEESPGIGAGTVALAIGIIALLAGRSRRRDDGA